MANQRDIKRRIATVANTQKITKAMKLVAAAKFAKSVQRVTQAKPYAKGLEETAKLVFASGTEDLARFRESGLGDRDLYVIFSTDRGLCGPLNSQLFKKLKPILSSSGQKPDFLTIGRKARTWVKQQGCEPIESCETIADKQVHAFSVELAGKLLGLFESGRYKSIFLVYNEFQSALVQTPLLQAWLPFAEKSEIKKLSLVVEQQASAVQESDVILEPDVRTLSKALMEALLVNKVNQSILQATASEHGSRMTAMDSASRNASDVKKKLTLKYNRARQAAITKELIEIISGAEAL